MSLKIMLHGRLQEGSPRRRVQLRAVGRRRRGQDGRVRTQRGPGRGGRNPSHPRTARSLRANAYAERFVLTACGMAVNAVVSSMKWRRPKRPGFRL